MLGNSPVEVCSTTWLFSSAEQTPTFYLNGLLVMEMWPPYSLFWSLNEDGSLQACVRLRACRDCRLA